ncbi:beta-ketoacyl reductase [Streptomyces sp. NPDC048506]|uniref:beta-ketoacyl reductase n=1 Tax=Streptomyces sp. NPDC048506 TaxID=3155028 RepID=UPI0034410A33
MGKVVVAFDPLDEPVPAERRGQVPRMDPQGTYLITGGLGGFGAASAGWLAERGVRHLALVSRRGDRAPEAPAVLTELSDERIAAVLFPKAAGAVVLDQLLAGRDLETFLMYSSGTTVVGNIRQANYVAANLWLEALVRHRRGRGAAGQAIVWGAIGEAGYVARNELTNTLASAGIEPVSLHEAFAAADLLTGSGLEVAGVSRYNWGRMRRLLPALAAPRFSVLFPEHMKEADYTREEILRALAVMSVQDAARAVADALAHLMAEVLHMDHKELDHNRRLDEYGLDSLMIAELLVSVRRRFDIEIPPMELLRSGGTITDISHLVLLRLGLSGDSRAAADDDTTEPASSATRE